MYDPESDLDYLYKLYGVKNPYMWLNNNWLCKNGYSSAGTSIPFE
jgi:hypothetical protein